MSIARRKDGRWIVRYKDADGKWQQKSFRDESIAKAWEADYLNAQAQAEERLSLGELVMLYFRSNPDKHLKTKKKYCPLSCWLRKRQCSSARPWRISPRQICR